MNQKQTNQSPDFDAQTKAFIAGIQKTDRDPISDLVAFNGSSPAQVKHLLDHFSANHGALDHWTFQDIAETLEAERHKRESEMRKQHAHDRFQLCRVYSVEHDITDIETSYFWSFSRQEISPDDIVEGDPITEYHEIDDVTLTVYPYNEDLFTAYGIVDVSAPVFHSQLTRAIVYVELPAYKNNRDFAICLHVPIYWVRGTELVAAGFIDQVLHEELIITSTSLIVPVIAVAYQQWCKPFDIMALPQDECGDQFISFLERARKSNPWDDHQPSLFIGDASPRPFPKIAVAMESNIAFEIASEIDDMYSMNESAARKSIDQQRRKNLLR